MLMGSYSLGDLILLRAVTMLHPGVGRSSEIVDLPVQRDNLSFPIIYSSSLKGALKSGLWGEDRRSARAIFGPDPDEEGKYPSAVIIGDAFTLVFPIRSLVGVYAFITSPILLNRLVETIKVIEASGKVNERIESLKISVENALEAFETKVKRRTEVLVSTPSLLQIEQIGGDIIVNEELRLNPITDKSIESLEDGFGIEHGRLLLAKDDIAREAIDRGILKLTRIKLRREEKTVEEGPWTEEYVPQWAIFQTFFLYSKPHGGGGDIGSVEAVRKKILDYLKTKKGYLLVGGHETIGKGVIKLDVIGEKME